MKFKTENYESKSGGGNIPAGNYEFIVSNAEEQESQKGNPMINLELLIVIPDRDNPVKVFDCLVFTENAIFKIEQFCKATGMPEKFKNIDGNVDIDLEPANCLNKQGLARFEPDNKSGYLRPKYYIDPAEKKEQPTGYQASPKKPFAAAAAPMPELPQADDDLNPDDIPF